MTLLAIILGGIVAITIAVTALIACAGPGYEDAAGFHAGEPPTDELTL